MSDVYIALSEIYSEYSALLLGLLIFAIIVWSLLAVCRWRIFVRCGLPGILGVIPVVNMYILSKGLGCTVFGVLSVITGMLGIVPGLGLIFLIISAVMNLIVQYRLTVFMRRPSWFVLLAAFAPFIYYPIMAFTGQSLEDGDVWDED